MVTSSNFQPCDRFRIDTFYASSQDLLLLDWFLHSLPRMPCAHPQVWCAGPSASAEQDAQRSFRLVVCCCRRRWRGYHYFLLEVVKVPYRRMGRFRTRLVRPMLPEWRPDPRGRFPMDHVYRLVQPESPPFRHLSLTLIAGASVLGFCICTIPKIHYHVMLVSTAFVGATAVMLGVDCYTAAGLKEVSKCQLQLSSTRS